MLNNNYIDALNNLKKSDPELYNILDSHNNELSKELSTISHSVRNMLSFINCSYQFMADIYPEAASYDFWTDIQTSLTQLINYTTRTSSYRYSFNKVTLQPIDLNKFLLDFPNVLESSIEESGIVSTLVYQRFWNFDLDPSISIISTDKYQLRSVLMELAINGLEFSHTSSPITLSSRIFDDSQFEIKISYASENLNSLKTHSTTELVKPFFSTQTDHAGLGLSIVHNICTKLQGTFSIAEHDGIVVNTLHFPVNPIL